LRAGGAWLTRADRTAAAGAFNDLFTFAAARARLWSRPALEIPGIIMSSILGPVLIVVAVAMVAVARSTTDEPVPFLRYWAVGQAYVLAILAGVVTGVGLTLSAWLP
jgi:hypothetical protein